jgi:hypothetical protein
MGANDKDSVRSRAKAGICYVALGGIICAWALLRMQSGVSTTSGGARSGPIPLEMVGGVAGIVVFMGLLQLVITLVLYMQQRRRSHLAQVNHLTNR